MIEPIGERQRSLVREETERFILLAEDLLGRRFSRIPVLFDLSGRAAGMFKVARGAPCIRYNPWIFAKYFEENLRGTVPHEVAHYIVHALHPRRRVRPHGAEWQALMEAFGADPGVTFSLDLEGVPTRRQRTHPYRCPCREHRLSTTRHNRSRSGRGQYLCRYCNGRLEYAG